MLKIKDDVDLETLKEYGFKLVEECRMPTPYLKHEIVDCYVKHTGAVAGNEIKIDRQEKKELSDVMWRYLCQE